MTEGQKLSVLVVDDARGIVEIYGRWLGDDYHVRTATDGQTALSMVDDGVDVLLIDRELPKMSGSTVVEEVRSLGHDPAVILLSSVEPDFDVIDVQFQECLTKPVMRRELVEAVERAGSGEFPDRSNPTVSGPKLGDHSTGTGDGGAGTDDRSDDADERPDAESSPDRADDADVSSARSEDEDITTRLQSLQRDLDETASKLSERAEERTQAIAERTAERSDDDRNRTEEPTDDESNHEGPVGTDDDRDASATDESTDPAEGAAISDEQPGASAGETEVSEEEAGISFGDDAETADEGDDGVTADEDEETLQQRVERLASRAQDLAEGEASPEADESDDA